MGLNLSIETVHREWLKDCVIDKHDLAETSRQTPIIHAKYLERYTLARLRLKRAEIKQKSLLKIKWLYYHGKLSEDEIEALGWKFDPFDGLTVRKSELEYYYDTDTDIQETIEKINYMKILVDTLKEIVDSLKWRHQTISNIIRWKQFEAGG